MIIVMLFITVTIVKKYFDTRNEDTKRVGPIRCCRKGEIQVVLPTPEPQTVNKEEVSNKSGTFEEVDDNVISESELERRKQLAKIIDTESTNF